jgi:hypothetical protein
MQFIEMLFFDEIRLPLKDKLNLFIFIKIITKNNVSNAAAFSYQVGLAVAEKNL